MKKYYSERILTQEDCDLITPHIKDFKIENYPLENPELKRVLLTSYNKLNERIIIKILQDS